MPVNGSADNVEFLHSKNFKLDPAPDSLTAPFPQQRHAQPVLTNTQITMETLVETPTTVSAEQLADADAKYKKARHRSFGASG